MTAPIKITVKVDYAAVLVMARELSKYSPIPYKRIVLLEVASIVKICALRAKIASAAAIKKAALDRIDTGYESPDGSLVTINKHRDKGRTWFVPGDRSRDRGPGGTFLMVFAAGPARGHHLPDFAWQTYLLAIGDKQGALKSLIQSLLQRRGIMRLSWLQIGDALGVPLSSVSPSGSLQEVIARNARGPGGRIFRNGTAEVLMTSRTLGIRVRNESPLAIKNQGQREIDRAAAQRLKGFEIAMKKGVLEDLQLRAVRWRGIFVRAA